jgi:hypothetical protein
MEEKPMSVRILPIVTSAAADDTPHALLGVFGQDAIDRAIARAGATLGDGKSGVVIHLDDHGEVSASVIKRFGDHVTVEGAAMLDTSTGWKFDRAHLAVKGEVVISW